VKAVLALLTAMSGACGVAPVSTTPRPPPVTMYIDPHHRPRAYGGGICPLLGRHTHVYPPVPAAAFVPEGDAWRDGRLSAP
jgi:hypothetical protein